MNDDEARARTFPARKTPGGENEADPIAMIEAEHARQVEICAWIEDFAESLEHTPAPESARVLLEYLTEDLPRHTLFEEEGLFPLLRSRAEPEDRIEPMLSRLTEEHELDAELVDYIKADLSRIAEGRMVPRLERFFANVLGFAETQRRHLTWENEEILALARKRLEEEDLRSLRELALAR